MSIIIVGAGMAGATLALAISALSHGKVTVKLVENARPQQHSHPGFDARAIALAHGTCQQLIKIGVWPALKACATAITKVHVSDQGHANFVNMAAQDYQIDALGQVIELHEAGKVLFTLLEQAPGVQLYCPDQVVDVVRTVDYAEVALASGQRLRGQLLVAADGSRSILAQSCQVQWWQKAYQQFAVIANLVTEKEHAGCAFERFTSKGPLALLPMSQGRSALVWCHANADYTAVTGWDDEYFIAQLQQSFGWRLGKISKVGKRSYYPLNVSCAEKHVMHRLALVGNAAQTLHPIAGQGFNLGLRDVISLAQIVAASALRGEDFGAYSQLARYQQSRREDQQLTFGMTNGLISLFANDYTPLVIGRNLGLSAMGHFNILRDMLAQRALGWVAH